MVSDGSEGTDIGCGSEHDMHGVIAKVRDPSTGKPIHHGVVERCYLRLLECIQLYVLEMQEDTTAPTCYSCMMCITQSICIVVYAVHRAISCVFSTYAQHATHECSE